MREPLPRAAEIERLFELAASGITSSPVADERWESLFLNVARRGVVTAEDRRAAGLLLVELAEERFAVPGSVAP